MRYPVYEVPLLVGRPVRPTGIRLHLRTSPETRYGYLRYRNVTLLEVLLYNVGMHIWERSIMAYLSIIHQKEDKYENMLNNMPILKHSEPKVSQGFREVICTTL